MVKLRLTDHDELALHALTDFASSERWSEKLRQVFLAGGHAYATDSYRCAHLAVDTDIVGTVHVDQGLLGGVVDVMPPDHPDGWTWPDFGTIPWPSVTDGERIFPCYQVEALRKKYSRRRTSHGKLDAEHTCAFFVPKAIRPGPEVVWPEIGIGLSGWCSGFGPFGVVEARWITRAMAFVSAWSGPDAFDVSVAGGPSRPFLVRPFAHRDYEPSIDDPWALVMPVVHMPVSTWPKSVFEWTGPEGG